VSSGRGACITNSPFTRSHPMVTSLAPDHIDDRGKFIAWLAIPADLNADRAEEAWRAHGRVEQDE
jgi:hypothetical protein